MSRGGKTRSHVRSLFLALSLAACGDEDDAAPLPDLPCEIREAQCQQAVFRATADLRKQRDATMPDIRVITRAQFIEETRSGSGAPPSWRIQTRDAGLRLLAFLPANLSNSEANDEAAIGGVAAYYSLTGEKSITVVDDSATTPAEGVYALSHEFVHALQDQREGLEQLSRFVRSADGRIAALALTEGEAVALSNALLDSIRFGAVRDQASWFDDLLSDFLGLIAESPAPYVLATQTLAYPVGGRPLAAAYRTRGYDAIAEQLVQHPLTYAGWVEGQDALLPVPLACASTEPPEGYTVVLRDRFGGAGLLSLYTRLGLTGRDAYEAARAWTNDELTVYGPSDQRQVAAALSWRLGLRSSEDAARLVALLRASQLELEAAQTDREVHITGATDASVLASWSAREACSALKHATPRDDDPSEDERLFPPRPWQAAHRHPPPRL